MKLLIANPFGIGDVLFTTPVIANIKRVLPDCSISYLCNARVKPLLEQNPKIDKIFVYEKDEFRELWHRSKCKFLDKIHGLFSKIKSEDFDIVLDYSLAGEFSFVFWLAGIRTRIGYDYKKRGRSLNKKIILKEFNGKHIIEYYLNLLKFLNIKPEEKDIELFVSQKEKGQAKDFLQSKGIEEDNAVAVLPGGGASWGKDFTRKHYPADRFAAVCDRLIDEYKCKIIILGDEKEKQIVANLLKSMKNKPSLAYTSLSLRGFIAVLSQCKLVVCNDGGPLHVAVGLGVPTVSVFGPVDEKVYGPYPDSQRHKAISASLRCRPCYKKFKMPACQHRKCLTELSPDVVFNACREQLKF